MGTMSSAARPTAEGDCRHTVHALRDTGEGARVHIEGHLLKQFEYVQAADGRRELVGGAKIDRTIHDRRR